MAHNSTCGCLSTPPGRDSYLPGSNPTLVSKHLRRPGRPNGLPPQVSSGEFLAAN
jgi:hypothetical protein